jgi:hypothetical protein
LNFKRRGSLVSGNTRISFRRVDLAVASDGDGRSVLVLLLLALALIALLNAASAKANIGYELAKPSSVFVSGIEFPHGVAVDQANQRVYVAVVTESFANKTHGEIRRFESNGSAAGTFVEGSPDAFFSGVAVNPVTQGFYGSQVKTAPAFGGLGTAQMDPFSSAGVMATPFSLSAPETLPQIATDSHGDVYFPDAITGSVKVFNSTGSPQETIQCSNCPGGAFGDPISVAIDSGDNLYVADNAPDRVVKFTLSGGSYHYASVLQSGRGAAAVGVDPSTDDVFVGDLPGGSSYHIVAYDSTGTQFDDFGAGLFIDPALGVNGAAQIAANATTHRLYLTESEHIYMFDRVTSTPPTASVSAASAVAQLGATLNASVNAKGHATLECEFEFTTDVDFQVNSFTNATSVPCSTKPDGSVATPVLARASGLSPATVYRYRVTATSSAGTATSGDQSFETLPAVAPTVTTQSPLATTQTTAKIAGKVNPHGGTVSNCHFELGLSTSYGASGSCSPTPGSVTTDVAVSRSVAELAVGTTYHYRLVVTSNAGTVAGDDIEFTTLPATPQPDPLPEAESSQAPAPSSPDPAPGGGPAPPSHPKPCRKGFRRRKVHGKVKCVKRHPKRHSRRHRSRKQGAR